MEFSQLREAGGTPGKANTKTQKIMAVRVEGTLVPRHLIHGQD